MQLVEQHVISRRDPRHAVIDEAAFKSKHLYNAANYEYRQAFIHEILKMENENKVPELISRRRVISRILNIPRFFWGLAPLVRLIFYSLSRKPTPRVP